MQFGSLIYKTGQTTYDYGTASYAPMSNVLASFTTDSVESFSFNISNGEKCWDWKKGAGMFGASWWVEGKRHGTVKVICDSNQPQNKLLRWQFPDQDLRYGESLNAQDYSSEHGWNPCSSHFVFNSCQAVEVVKKLKSGAEVPRSQSSTTTSSPYTLLPSHIQGDTFKASTCHPDLIPTENHEEHQLIV